jgi:hypothetical protein
MINVTIKGFDGLKGDLKAMPPEMEKRVILNMSQIAYDSAQKSAGRHFKTGALFQSLYNRAITGGRSVGHDPSRAPHALFVIFGTRPHVITPNKKKALRWVGPGGFVFAKKVNHPGYRGDDYMSEARDNAVLQFQKITRDALRASL